MASPLLFAGAIVIAVALLLLYYFKAPPKKGVTRDALRERETQLRDIIKTIRADYYRRKISQVEANKLLLEYEGELRQVLRKIELSDAIESYSAGQDPVIPKEKQHIIIGAAVVIGILLMALSFIPAERKETPPPENNVDMPGDQDYYDYAQASEDMERIVANCSLVENPLMKDDCFFDASRGEDIANGFDLCKRVQDLVKKEECLRQLPLDDSTGTAGDVDIAIEICTLIPEGDECLMNISEAAAISNPEKAFEACMGIGADNKQDACLSTLAKGLAGWDNEAAVNMCSNLGNDYRRYECMGSVWFNIPHVVVSDLNMSIFVCDNLVIKNEECYSRVVQAFLQLRPDMLEEVCEEVGSVGREECDRAMGQRDRETENNTKTYEDPADNISVYEMIGNCSAENLTQRDNCIIKIVSSVAIRQAPMNTSLAICGDLSTREARDDCFLALAGSISDVSKSEAIKACIGIESQEKWSICIKDYG